MKAIYCCVNQRVLNMEKRTVRRSFQRFFDVSSWLGMAEIKKNTSNLKSLATILFTVAKPERRETFEEAVARFQLSEADIAKRQQAFFQIAMLYLAGFILDICYVIYLYATQRYMSAIMALAFAGVLFSMFFRQHFWYTQMKHRRLGFTFQQWVRSLFK